MKTFKQYFESAPRLMSKHEDAIKENIEAALDLDHSFSILKPFIPLYGGLQRLIDGAKTDTEVIDLDREIERTEEQKRRTGNIDDANLSSLKSNITAAMVSAGDKAIIKMKADPKIIEAVLKSNLDNLKYYVDEDEMIDPEFEFMGEVLGKDEYDLSGISPRLQEDLVKSNPANIQYVKDPGVLKKYSHIQKGTQLGIFDDES